ncbi:hypothetical protein Hamer_G021697, partial [Homarus americanus]
MAGKCTGPHTLCHQPLEQVSAVSTRPLLSFIPRVASKYSNARMSMWWWWLLILMWTTASSCSNLQQAQDCLIYQPGSRSPHNTKLHKSFNGVISIGFSMKNSQQSSAVLTISGGSGANCTINVYYYTKSTIIQKAPYYLYAIGVKCGDNEKTLIEEPLDSIVKNWMYISIRIKPDKTPEDSVSSHLLLSPNSNIIVPNFNRNSRLEIHSTIKKFYLNCRKGCYKSHKELTCSLGRSIFYVRITTDSDPGRLTVNTTYHYDYTQVISLPPDCLTPNTWQVVSLSGKRQSLTVRVDGQQILENPTNIYFPKVTGITISLEEGGLLTWCKPPHTDAIHTAAWKIATGLLTVFFTTSGIFWYLWHQRNQLRTSNPEPKGLHLKFFSESTPPPLPPPLIPPSINRPSPAQQSRVPSSPIFPPPRAITIPSQVIEPPPTYPSTNS